MSSPVRQLGFTRVPGAPGVRFPDRLDRAVKTSDTLAENIGPRITPNDAKSVLHGDDTEGMWQGAGLGSDGRMTVAASALRGRVEFGFPTLREVGIQTSKAGLGWMRAPRAKRYTRVCVSAEIRRLTDRRPETAAALFEPNATCC